jgi:hypothetical protein
VLPGAAKARETNTAIRASARLAGRWRSIGLDHPAPKLRRVGRVIARHLEHLRMTSHPTRKTGSNSNFIMSEELERTGTIA